MDVEEHLISLKVMRLTRPNLAFPTPITCDSKDLPGNLLNNVLQQDPTAVAGAETLCTGQFLMVPLTPVDIYLGETFTSLICVYSETQQTVSNLMVKVDLQTNSQKLTLSKEPPVARLQPNETVDLIIRHEVIEIGAHILICEVSYLTAQSAPMSFKKFFKIQVLKPLDVKTKFYNAKTDDVFLEAQVQNLTNGPICLERIDLDASPLFNVTSLNVTSDNKSIFGPIIRLKTQAISQFVYCLTPKDDLSMNLKSMSSRLDIGKLDIVWRSHMGEQGRLQTNQLQKMEIEYGDLRLSVVEIPNFVQLEQLFSFKCKLVNNCERVVDLIICLENVDGIAWCDISGRKLNSLQPQASINIDFKCIPLKPGLRTISGVKLIDSVQRRTYTYDQLTQVYVLVNK